MVNTARPGLCVLVRLSIRILFRCNQLWIKTLNEEILEIAIQIKHHFEFSSPFLPSLSFSVLFSSLFTLLKWPALDGESGGTRWPSPPDASGIVSVLNRNVVVSNQVTASRSCKNQEIYYIIIGDRASSSRRRR
ncbi:PREDICTED: uncharacterized protein LOC104783249 isoform X2 [Camelina sativa]|uniref:Uncharacterized protein LOC104783249 isoform X2 n=1 Tax=Camelina sativa TaxID=90675 RepID=A0ABM0YW02_CAMSA|nr:PREDICTED: uncharacterized protein LOC104783249 isoform X2 [Camelina sativa]